MTLAEKIAQTPKLERIDSSIDSCIKIIEQELKNRYGATANPDTETNHLLNLLGMFRDDFNIMKGKK